MKTNLSNRYQTKLCDRAATATAILLLLPLAALAMQDWLAHKLGGDFRGEQEDVPRCLSPAASALVEKVFADLGGAPLEDYHAHLVGLGAGGTGAEVNPRLLSWRHPFRRFGSAIYFSAAGVGSMERCDAEYLARLVRLARSFGHPIKIHLLALDHYYNPDGTINRERTEFYVPNEYVVAVARQYPDVFVPVVSIHPARPDALAELDRWARAGVHYVKWLPNAQGIDPADARYDAFYRAMRDHGMALLTHAGDEGAVSASGGQTLGNPLRLRRPLDLGVQVIAAHCGSRGRGDDLDHPGQRARNFDLFLRLMDEPRYRGLLFADVSALTQVNRLPRPWLELIRRPELQDRLVNGSDYPMPAVNGVIWTGYLVCRGMITADERQALNEIYRLNPLLFDYALKRTIRDPHTGRQLPAQVFLARRALPAAVAN